MAAGRKTGGRTKGTPNKATVAKVKFLDGVVARDLSELTPEERDKLSPLDVMLVGMRTSLRANKIGDALMFARDAAPYIHPRLASTDTTIKSDNVHRVVSDTPTDAAEWAAKYGAHANDAAAPELSEDAERDSA